MLVRPPSESEGDLNATGLSLRLLRLGDYTEPAVLGECGDVPITEEYSNKDQHRAATD